VLSVASIEEVRATAVPERLGRARVPTDGPVEITRLRAPGSPSWTEQDSR